MLRKNNTGEKKKNPAREKFRGRTVEGRKTLSKSRGALQTDARRRHVITHLTVCGGGDNSGVLVRDEAGEEQVTRRVTPHLSHQHRSVCAVTDKDNQLPTGQSAASPHGSQTMGPSPSPPRTGRRGNEDNTRPERPVTIMADKDQCSKSTPLVSQRAPTKPRTGQNSLKRSRRDEREMNPHPSLTDRRWGGGLMEEDFTVLHQIKDLIQVCPGNRKWCSLQLFQKSQELPEDRTKTNTAEKIVRSPGDPYNQPNTPTQQHTWSSEALSDVEDRRTP